MLELSGISVSGYVCMRYETGKAKTPKFSLANVKETQQTGEFRATVAKILVAGSPVEGIDFVQSGTVYRVGGAFPGEFPVASNTTEAKTLTMDGGAPRPPTIEFLRRRPPHGGLCYAVSK